MFYSTVLFSAKSYDCRHLSRKFVENLFRHLAGLKIYFLSQQIIFLKCPGPKQNFVKKLSSKSSRPTETSEKQTTVHIHCTPFFLCNRQYRVQYRRIRLIMVSFQILQAKLEWGGGEWVTMTSPIILKN